jgi:hypothetical protein
MLKMLLMMVFFVTLPSCGDDESPSTGDSDTGEAYDPCADKACGDICFPCPPNGMDPCETPEEPMYCDRNGTCHGTLDDCSDDVAPEVPEVPEGCDFLTITVVPLGEGSDPEY